MSCMLIEVLVVTAHYAPCASFNYCSMEWAQIKFIQSTVGNSHIHMVAEGFLFIKRVMFYAARHTLGLKTLNIRNTHPRSKIRILSHIFKVATVKRRAV